VGDRRLAQYTVDATPQEVVDRVRAEIERDDGGGDRETEVRWARRGRRAVLRLVAEGVAPGVPTREQRLRALVGNELVLRFRSDGDRTYVSLSARRRWRGISLGLATAAVLGGLALDLVVLLILGVYSVTYVAVQSLRGAQRSHDEFDQRLMLDRAARTLGRLDVGQLHMPFRRALPVEEG
jgi:hypothetical protein